MLVQPVPMGFISNSNNPKVFETEPFNLYGPEELKFIYIQPWGIHIKIVMTQGIRIKIDITLKYLNSNSWQVVKNLMYFKLYNNNICFKLQNKSTNSTTNIIHTITAI